MIIFCFPERKCLGWWSLADENDDDDSEVMPETVAAPLSLHIFFTCVGLGRSTWESVYFTSPHSCFQRIYVSSQQSLPTLLTLIGVDVYPPDPSHLTILFSSFILQYSKWILAVASLPPKASLTSRRNCHFEELRLRWKESRNCALFFPRNSNILVYESTYYFTTSSSAPRHPFVISIQKTSISFGSLVYLAWKVYCVPEGLKLDGMKGKNGYRWKRKNVWT